MGGFNYSLRGNPSFLCLSVDKQTVHLSANMTVCFMGQAHLVPNMDWSALRLHDASGVTHSTNIAADVHWGVYSVQSKKTDVSQWVRQNGSNESWRNDYQIFIDEWPVHRFNANHHGARSKFGKSPALRMPSLLARFDWCIRPGLATDTVFDPSRDPHSIYVNPNLMPDFSVRLLELAPKVLSPSHNNRSLVLAGADKLLSQIFTGQNVGAQVQRLQRYFGRIFAEAKDIHIEGIELMPIPLTEDYLHQNQPEATTAIAEANIDNTAKPRKVLAAWGFHWPGLEFTHSVKDRHTQSRMSARTWVSSVAARDSGVELREINAKHWWSELASYKFVPHGCVESKNCRTVY